MQMSKRTMREAIGAAYQNHNYNIAITPGSKDDEIANLFGEMSERDVLAWAVILQNATRMTH